MKGFGISLLLLGLVIAIGSLFFDTTIVSGSADLPAFATAPAALYNVGLLQKQMMTFVCGIALTVAGVVLIAAGFVSEQLGRQRSTPSVTVPTVLEAPPAPPPAEPTEARVPTKYDDETEKLGNQVILIVACVVFTMFTIAVIAIFTRHV